MTQKTFKYPEQIDEILEFIEQQTYPVGILHNPYTGDYVVTIKDGSEIQEE